MFGVALGHKALEVGWQNYDFILICLNLSSFAMFRIIEILFSF